MSEVIDVTRNSDAFGSQVRFFLDHEKTFHHEQGKELNDIYQFWSEAQANRAGVRYANLIGRRHLLPVAAQKTITIIDAQAFSPTEFLVKEHAIRSGFECSEGKRIGEIDWKLNQSTLIMEYMLAKEIKQPMYDEVHQWNENGSRHYARLLLPLCGIEGNVTKFIVAARLYDSSVVPLSNALQSPIFG